LIIKNNNNDELKVVISEMDNPVEISILMEIINDNNSPFPILTGEGSGGKSLYFVLLQIISKNSNFKKDNRND